MIDGETKFYVDQENGNILVFYFEDDDHGQNIRQIPLFVLHCTTTISTTVKQMTTKQMKLRNCSKFYCICRDTSPTNFSVSFTFPARKENCIDYCTRCFDGNEDNVRYSSIRYNMNMQQYCAPCFLYTGPLTTQVNF